MNQRWIASGSQEPLARVHEGEAAPAQTLRKHMTPDNFDNAGGISWAAGRGSAVRANRALRSEAYR